MKKLTVRIEAMKDLGQAVLHSIEHNSPEATAGLNFSSFAEMHRVLTPKRLDIIRAMAGESALSYHEVARRVGRDFKGVHTDLTAMIVSGIIDRDEMGVIFPYETIHFEFDIQANAA